LREASDALSKQADYFKAICLEADDEQAEAA
jgi:hypothetical protein